jgi:hypothetical protein
MARIKILWPLQIAHICQAPDRKVCIRPSARVLSHRPRCQQELSFVVTLKAYCVSGNAFQVLQVLGQAVPGIRHHYEN